MVVSSLVDHKLLALGSAATASGILVAALWYRQYMKSQPPTRWIQIGEVGDLWIYPVKSCAPVTADVLECTYLGFRKEQLRDRMFMVVDAEGTMITARNYPQMIHIIATVTDTALNLSAEDCDETAEVNFGQFNGDPQSVIIWKSRAEGIDCGDEVARWLSRYLLGSDQGMRLLYHQKEDIGKSMNSNLVSFMRLTNKTYQETDTGLFSDAMSFHVISEASVNELNNRVGSEHITPLNFRPNLVIKGEKLIPYEEDHWEWLKVGNIVFQCLAPCTRCILTTIDPTTAKKSEKFEPLKSLRKYRNLRNPEQRKIMNAPAMGIYLGARCEGEIRAGDAVYVPLP